MTGLKFGPGFGRDYRTGTPEARPFGIAFGTYITLFAATSLRYLTLRARRAFTLIELLSVMAIIGILASIALPKLSETIEDAKVAKAIGDIRAIAIDLYAVDSLPASLAQIGRGSLLDPWGRPYQYLRFSSSPPGQARKDRFLVPINTAFDLYSLGKDGVSSPPLTASGSRDDVILANDGGFIGKASAY